MRNGEEKGRETQMPQISVDIVNPNGNGTYSVFTIPNWQIFIEPENTLKYLIEARFYIANEIRMKSKVLNFDSQNIPGN